MCPFSARSQCEQHCDEALLATAASLGCVRVSVRSDGAATAVGCAVAGASVIEYKMCGWRGCWRARECAVEAAGVSRRTKLSSASTVITPRRNQSSQACCSLFDLFLACSNAQIQLQACAPCFAGYSVSLTALAVILPQYAAHEARPTAAPGEASVAGALSTVRTLSPYCADKSVGRARTAPKSGSACSTHSSGSHRRRGWHVAQRGAANACREGSEGYVLCLTHLAAVATHAAVAIGCRVACPAQDGRKRRRMDGGGAECSTRDGLN